jgi:hypothetical protein
MSATEFSAAALQLITEAEGLDQPHLWPGGDSGTAEQADAVFQGVVLPRYIQITGNLLGETPSSA